MSGVKGITGMHRFNIYFVVVLLSCSGVKTPLVTSGGKQANQSFLRHSARNLGLRYIVYLPFWDNKLSVMVYIIFHFSWFMLYIYIHWLYSVVFGFKTLDLQCLPPAQRQRPGRVLSTATKTGKRDGSSV